MLIRYSYLYVAGTYAFSVLRASVLNNVDELVKCVAQRWTAGGGNNNGNSSNCSKTVRDKVLAVCRALYHLREGALLDGPAAVGRNEIFCWDFFWLV